MDEFLLAKRTGDFIDALIAEERENGLGENSPKIDNQVVKKSKAKEKGKAGRPKEQVWMHPFLFTKFAMWINPRFEVKVVRFVYDEMIRYRNDAGDAYKELSAAVMKIVPKDFMPKAMQKVGEALNWIVFNNHEKMLRNKHGDEAKQRELYQLEKKVADLINEGFISSYDNLLIYLRNQYQKRNYPRVFDCAS
ncbi:KilA-N domain [Bacteroides thetaiotaomicron]|uniref:KilA-N domain n=1 Tax=Bacteroides thetaiotaomicron TaxID=818 RepID=A0A174ULB0_BACT4|nr:KilA-N domain [Bacteroides thetaiotaomicron]